MAQISFRIIENDKVKTDTIPVSLPVSKNKHDTRNLYSELIKTNYEWLKKIHPNSKIIAVVSMEARVCYEPKSELLSEDIYKMVEELDEELKKGAYR